MSGNGNCHFIGRETNVNVLHFRHYRRVARAQDGATVSHQFYCRLTRAGSGYRVETEHVVVVVDGHVGDGIGQKGQRPARGLIAPHGLQSPVRFFELQWVIGRIHNNGL